MSDEYYNNVAAMLQTGSIPVPALAIDLSEAARVNALVGNGFNGGWEAIRSQLKIIQNELDEAIESAENEDYATLQDDIGDLLFTVGALPFRSGFQFTTAADFAAVVASQYTKFDTSLEEWQRTEAKYNALGIQVEYQVCRDNGAQRDYWVTRSAIDQLDEKGRKCSKGKWLKSYKFTDPVLTPIPEYVKVVLGTKEKTEPVAEVVSDIIEAAPGDIAD